MCGQRIILNTPETRAYVEPVLHQTILVNIYGKINKPIGEYFCIQQSFLDDAQDFWKLVLDTSLEAKNL